MKIRVPLKKRDEKYRQIKLASNKIDKTFFPSFQTVVILYTFWGTCLWHWGWLPLYNGFQPFIRRILTSSYS